MRTIFKGGTVIDCTGRDPVTGIAVAVKDGRIEAMGREAEFGSMIRERNVNVIDISGKWILPGLINAHDHIHFKEAIGPTRRMHEADVRFLTIWATRTVLKLLRRGITTIREMGTVHGISLFFRDAINLGELPGPRMLVCGSPIAITGGHSFWMCAEADGPDAFRKAAREQIKRGADFVKCMASQDPISMPGSEQTVPEPTVDELRAAFEEAHEHGKRTGCHCVGTVALSNVIEAGVDVIDHGIYLNDNLAERVAAKDIYLTPTFSAYSKQTMDPKFQRGKEWADENRPLAEAQPNSVMAAVRAGVKIINGTDSTGRYAEEVELLRGVGLGKMDSLLACTKYAAEALGWQDQIGTIEPGKFADLVVLGGNPLDDPYALEQVELVVKDGKAFRPSEIKFPLLDIYRPEDEGHALGQLPSVQSGS